MSSLSSNDNHNDNFIYNFISSYYNHPKTPYQLFINRITSNGEITISPTSINYFTLENLIISNLIYIELITRPIKKLNENSSYWIEIDKSKREYTFFVRNPKSTLTISDYIGNNKEIQDILIRQKKITYNNVKLRKLIYNEYLSLINKDFLYESMDIDDSRNFINSIRNSISSDSYQSTLDKINSVTFSDEEIDTDTNTFSDEEINSNKTTIHQNNNHQLFYNMRIDSPNRIFSCVPGVDSINCIGFIKNNLKSSNDLLMRRYSKYVYYLYHSSIPIDSYYRLGLYENPYNIITYQNLKENYPSLVDDHPTNKAIQLANSDFILSYQVFDNVAPYYFFGEDRYKFYGDDIKKLMYNLPSIYNRFQTVTNFTNSKAIKKDIIFPKDSKNKCFKIKIKYDQFYQNELYQREYGINFTENELFDYTISNDTNNADDNDNETNDEFNYPEKHPNYYSDKLRLEKINLYTKEALLNREFSIESSSEEEKEVEIQDIEYIIVNDTSSNTGKQFNKGNNTDKQQKKFNKGTTLDTNTTTINNNEFKLESSEEEKYDIDNPEYENDDILLLVSIIENDNSSQQQNTLYNKDEIRKLKLLEFKEQLQKNRNDLDQMKELERDYNESLLLYEENNTTHTVVKKKNKKKSTTSSSNSKNIIEILSSPEEIKNQDDDKTIIVDDDNLDDNLDDIVFLGEKRSYTTSNTENSNNNTTTTDDITKNILSNTPFKKRKLYKSSKLPSNPSSSTTSSSKYSSSPPPKDTNWINWKKKK